MPSPSQKKVDGRAVVVEVGVEVVVQRACVVVGITTTTPLLELAVGDASRRLTTTHEWC